MAMASQIVLRDRSCEGTLVHVRHVPVSHRFSYRIWLAWVDLDAFDGTLALGPLWSNRRPAPMRLRQTDHLPVPAAAGLAASATLRERLRWHLRQHALGDAVDGQVFVLTQPRNWGFSFNPVTFFFCFDQTGTLRALAAEVTNTPWGERFVYAVPAEAGPALADKPPQRYAMSMEKRFHVSPFMVMALRYVWNIRLDDARVELDMRVFDADIETFRAALSLECQPLTRSTATWAALRFPAQNMRNLFRIYRQAFALWRRGAPIHPHPETRKTA
jgi:uncharacterized protein